MTSSARPASSWTVRSRGRIGAIVLVSLSLLGAGASAAYAGPDTNIQKPGHVA